MDFVDFVREDVRRHGITLYLYNRPSVKVADNQNCTGYFCFEDRVIKVGTGRRCWRATLAHEYCHMLQWVDDKVQFAAACEATVPLDDWLAHEVELSKSEVRRMLRITTDVEQDCEKRAYRLMQEHGFRIDERYIQKANSYIKFWEFVGKYRCWWTRPPYDAPVIWKQMPTTFRKRIPISDAVEAAYLRLLNR